MMNDFERNIQETFDGLKLIVLLGIWVVLAFYGIAFFSITLFFISLYCSGFSEASDKRIKQGCSKDTSVSKIEMLSQEHSDAQEARKRLIECLGENCSLNDEHQKIFFKTQRLNSIVSRQYNYQKRVRFYKTLLPTLIEAAVIFQTLVVLIYQKSGFGDIMSLINQYWLMIKNPFLTFASYNNSSDFIITIDFQTTVFIAFCITSAYIVVRYLYTQKSQIKG